MARYCLNCKEDNLRNQARFCDCCGVKLVEPEAKAIDDAATRSVPEVLDEASTRLLPEAETGGDGSTRFLADLVTTDEIATRVLPEAESRDDSSTRFLTNIEAVDESATRILPETETGGDGATRFLPELEVDNDLVTRLLPENRVVSYHQPTKPKIENETLEDRSTRLLAEITAADDGGATRLLPQAEATDKGPAKVVPETQPAQETASPKQAGDFQTGHILQNRYQLTKVLGRGGFGAAFLAEDIKLKRRCVVKQMLAKRKSSKEFAIQQTNFEREARLLAELNQPGHPNIPEIYDYFSDDSGNYLVMKYIEGHNLKDRQEQSAGKLPWREAVRYAIDICSALNYMHTQQGEPVMHRDIKPANILLGDDGRVWLVDFGLAKANPVKSSSDPLATQALGSLGYTPLEQWLGQAVPASDVYAVGVTLHHLVTGLNPLDAYEGEFHIQKLQEKHGQLPPIRKFDRKLPKELEEIISQATATEPDQRPTPLQLQQQLDILISGAQEAALYTFKNGQSAKTVAGLVDLCQKNRREAEAYLFNGDFERWFRLINRNDMAEAAAQAVKQGKNQKDGLEKFLKLILPNLFLRRLGKASWHLTRLAVQAGLILIMAVLIVTLAGSYLAGWFIQQSLGSLDWNFYTLDLKRENRYTEAFLTEKFQFAAGAYFNDIEVKLHPPDQLEVRANWSGMPLRLPLTVRLENKKPHFYLTGINEMPLFFVANNISQGINNGVDEAFRRGPVDISTLKIEEQAVVFKVELSGRVPLATPTPMPTPTPSPTPVNITLVVIFNELDHDISLEIKDQAWSIAANDNKAIEVPPGTYSYIVRYKETGSIAARGTKTWTLNKAYRLRIDLEENNK